MQYNLWYLSLRKFAYEIFEPMALSIVAVSILEAIVYFMLNFVFKSVYADSMIYVYIGSLVVIVTYSLIYTFVTVYIKTIDEILLLDQKENAYTLDHHIKYFEDIFEITGSSFDNDTGLLLAELKRLRKEEKKNER